MTNSTFELLAQCIRSGQLSDRQVQLELQNIEFRRWYFERYGLKDTPPDPEVNT